MLTSLFLLLIKAETTPDSTSAASASSHHALGHEAPSKDFRIATKAARLLSQLGASSPSTPAKSALSAFRAEGSGASHGSSISAAFSIRAC